MHTFTHAHEHTRAHTPDPDDEYLRFRDSVVLDESPYDRSNIIRPSNVDNFDEDEILLRNLDSYGHNSNNIAYRTFNFGPDDLAGKRYYLEHKFSNQYPSAKQQQQQQPTHFLSSHQSGQHQSAGASGLGQQKRAIDSIGGANLLKRAVDRLGGGHLLKRR